MSRSVRDRARTLAADLAARALKPATHAEVIALFCVLLVLGTVALLAHGHDIHRLTHDEGKLTVVEHRQGEEQQAQARSRVEAAAKTCHEANAQHAKAEVGLEELAAHNPPKKPPTPEERAQTKRVLRELANVFDPSYDCARRVRELTQAHEPRPPTARDLQHAGF